MKYLFFVILFVVQQFIFSQTYISGKVKDSIGAPLVNANVIVKNHTHTLGYAITDDNGYFELKLKTYPEYIVKATFLGYKPDVIKVTSRDNLRQIELTLYELKTQLTEVVINSDLPDIVQKKDTILYNLSKLTDGKESTLKDIVEKLPGMDIDAAGKIKLNGKPIDKVLINGKEFFNKQHQLATENISSDMVKAIAFYNNFKTSLDTRSDRGIRAINVTLKDKYNNRVTGNITVAGSYDKRYKLHPNLFNFRKNMNIAFIGNINTFGKQAISLSDYMTFTGGVNSYIKDVRPGDVEIDEENIPDFLLNENEVEHRNVHFGGLNIVFQKPKKYSFSGFYLINSLLQSENTTSKKNYWNNTKINETKKSQGDYFIITTYSQLKYKIAKKTILKWLVTGSYQKDLKQDTLALNNQLLKQNLNNEHKRFGSKLSISHNFNNDFEWSGDFITDYSYQTKNRIIAANYPIFELLIPPNKQRVQHQVLKDYLNKHFATKLTKYSLHNQFYLELNYDQDRKNYKTINRFDSFNNDLLLKKYDIYTSLGIKHDMASWHIDASISHHHLNIKYNNGRQIYNYFSPNIHILYLFNLNQSVSAGYSYSNNIISPQKLLSNNTITDANVVYQSAFFSYSLLPVNRFYFNYSNYIKKIKMYMYINGNYSQKEKSINSSIEQIVQNTTYMRYRLFPAENHLGISYSLNKHITKHLLVNYKGVYSLENRTVYNNLNNRKLSVTSFQQKLKIYSKRKKSVFNYSFGLKYKLYEVAYQDNLQKFQYITYAPFLNLKGYFSKKYFWEIKSSYESYQNTILENYIKVNPSFEYKMNKTFNIALVGDNIFNIGRNEIVQWSTNEQYTEQKKQANLSGYISLQLKWLF